MSEEAEDKEAVFKPLAPAELAVAFVGAAPFANRCFVTIYGTTVRIAFAESFPNQEGLHFRAAVALNIGEAAQLVEVLSGMLRKPKTAQVLKAYMEAVGPEPE